MNIEIPQQLREKGFEINEEDILKFYEMLRHEHETELRAINPITSEIKSFHFKTK